MKITHQGRRETLPLGRPDKAAAAARARDIYLSLALLYIFRSMCIDKNSLTRVVPHSRIEAGLQGHAEYR